VDEECQDRDVVELWGRLSSYTVSSLAVSSIEFAVDSTSTAQAKKRSASADRGEDFPTGKIINSLN
jgi:hypothetical protein